MSVTLSVSGVKGVQAALRAAEGRARSAVQGVVNRYAATIAREAKGLAPVDTGALRESIRYVLSRFAAEVIAGNEAVTWAAVVELGRADNAGYPIQPYLGPAFEMHRAAFVRDITAAVRTALGTS